MMHKQFMQRLNENKMILLGSSSKAGNPIRLFGNISSGIKDLFRKPAERSQEGALSIGYGLVEGTESFFSKSIEAVFGTPGDLLGSLSSSIGSYSYDQEFVDGKFEEEKVEPA